MNKTSVVLPSFLHRRGPTNLPTTPESECKFVSPSSKEPCSCILPLLVSIPPGEQAAPDSEEAASPFLCRGRRCSGDGGPVGRATAASHTLGLLPPPPPPPAAAAAAAAAALPAELEM